MDLNLNGRRALVCGASRGIGRAIALALAGEGAHVVGVARTSAKLEETASAVRAAGGHMDGLVVDLLELDAVESQVGALVEELGAFHILVLNTGGPPAGPILDAVEHSFEDGFRAHVLAGQRLVKTLLPGMRSAGYGRVINIISTSVKQPIANLGVSNTIRGAVASWAKTLAGELGPSGITVNNVLPGYTDTERLRTLAASQAERRSTSVDEVLAGWAALVPLKRIGRPEEVAAAVAFLASPAAAYVNGINLPVDGGRLQTL